MNRPIFTVLIFLIFSSTFALPLLEEEEFRPVEIPISVLSSNPAEKKKPLETSYYKHLYRVLHKQKLSEKVALFWHQYNKIKTENDVNTLFSFLATSEWDHKRRAKGIEHHKSMITLYDDKDLLNSFILECRRTALHERNKYKREKLIYLLYYANKNSQHRSVLSQWQHYKPGDTIRAKSNPFTHLNLYRMELNEEKQFKQFTLLKEQKIPRDDTLFTITEKAEAGMYRCTFYSDSNITDLYYQVNALHATVHEDDEKLLLQVHSTDKSIKAPYKVYLRSGEHTIATFDTDLKGRLSIAKPDTENSLSLTCLIEKDRHLCFATLPIRKKGETKESGLLLYSYSDRPIYRPEQTVYVKSIIVKRDSSGTLSNPGLDSVKIHYTMPNSTDPISHTVPVDSFGHVCDSLPLEESAPLGEYKFEIKSTDPEMVILQGTKRGGVFTVQEYKKSEFETNVKAVDTIIYEKDTATVVVEAAYFTGKPLDRADVRIRWYRAQTSLSEYYYYPDYNYIPNHTKLLTETEHTIENGRLEAHYFNETVNTGYHLWAEVITTDASRRELRDTVCFSVKTRRGYLYHDKSLNKGSASVFEPNKKHTFHLKCRDYDNNPFTQEIAIIITKKGKSNPIIDTIVKSNSRGEAQLTTRFDKEDDYQFHAQTVINDSIHKCSFTFEVNSVRSQLHEIIKQLEGYTITADKKEYAPGDTALVTITSAATQDSVLISLIDDKILTMKKYPFDNDSITVAVPIIKGSGSSLSITATPLGITSHDETTHLTIPIIDSTLILKASLKAERDLKPGEQFKGTLVVSDREGKSVPANFSVALVDEALFHIQQEISTYHFNSDSKEKPTGIFELFPFEQKAENNHIRSEAWSYMLLHSVGVPYISHYLSYRNRRFAHFDSNMESNRYTFDAATVEGYMDSPTPFYITDADHSIDPVEYKREPRVRFNFKDLGYWNPSVTTNKRGKAKLNFTMPDDLTTWRLAIIGSSGKAQFVDFVDTLKTDLPLMVRLQAPRTLVEGDSLLLTAIVHNASDMTMKGKVTMNLDSSSCEAQLLSSPNQQVSLKAGERKQVNFPCRVSSKGALSCETAILTKEDSDAERRTYPVRDRALIKYTTENGFLQKSDTAKHSLQHPEDIVEGSQEYSLSIAPSMAHTLFESLEYLTAFPYDCVEQTMSKFLPNLYVKEALEKLNRELVSEKKSFEQNTLIGLRRLRECQNSEGGWGWWPGNKTDKRMTALVYYGLQYTRKFALSTEINTLVEDLLRNAEPLVAKLLSGKRVDDAHKIDLLYAYLHQSNTSRYDSLLVELSGEKSSLSTQSLSRLIELLHKREVKEPLQSCIEELMQRGKSTKTGYYWPGDQKYRWHSIDEEATACAVKALTITDPDNRKLPLAVHWLHTQKKRGYWVSTKTTAQIIGALSLYVAKQGEGNPESKIFVYADDQLIDSLSINAQSLNTKIAPITLPAESSTIRLIKNGTGTLYYSINGTFTSTEDYAKANSNGIQLKRSYQKLLYEKDKNGEWKVNRVPFDGTCKSGDEIEVTVTMKCDESYEHVMVEDFFPSGMEVLRKSQEWYSRWGDWWWSGYDNREARDDRMVFFMSRTSRGKTSMTYLLRAETPGRFTALPTKAECMYEPEISGNSEAMTVLIQN